MYEKMDPVERKRRIHWNLALHMATLFAILSLTVLGYVIFQTPTVFSDFFSNQKALIFTLISGFVLGLSLCVVREPEMNRRRFYNTFHLVAGSATQEAVTEFLTAIAETIRRDDERLIELQIRLTNDEGADLDELRRGIDRLEEEYRRLRDDFWYAHRMAQKCGFKTLPRWKFYLNKQLVAQLK